MFSPGYNWPSERGAEEPQEQKVNPFDFKTPCAGKCTLSDELTREVRVLEDKLRKKAASLRHFNLAAPVNALARTLCHCRAWNRARVSFIGIKIFGTRF